MVLNYIWIGFFLIALLVAIIKTISGGDEVFSAIVNSTFDMAEVSFEIAIGLTGILCLWLGIMKIGEMGGAVQLLSKLVGPFFNRLFPSVPKDHPAHGSMLMNFSANMLGLDNAATPMGLKAMKELQEINDEKDTASDAQIMFLVLNTSGLTLIPITVMNYRSQFGAENPADVFIPILLATFVATLVGLITVSFYQKSVKLLNKVVLAYLGGLVAIIVGMLYYFTNLSPEQLQVQSTLISNVILYGIICGFIIMAMIKKINVYEAFIEGAKEGFNIAITIIPYLVAILVSIGVFRASGAMDYLVHGMGWIAGLFMDNTEFVKGLPTAFMKPLSGSGARGMMLESFHHYGVDSFVGKLTSTLQGATDTTFYILAVYFGSVSIRKTRYAVKAGLLADLSGIIAAIAISYLFFGSSINGLTDKEAVAKFAQAWEVQELQKAATFVTDGVVVYDQSFDTLCTSKQGFIKLIESDLTKPHSPKKGWIKEIKEGKQKYLLLKMERGAHSNTYRLMVKNGKIRSMKCLTTFD
jgi:spore maturation protein SpmA